MEQLSQFGETISEDQYRHTTGENSWRVKNEKHKIGDLYIFVGVRKSEMLSAIIW